MYLNKSLLLFGCFCLLWRCQSAPDGSVADAQKNDIKPEKVEAITSFDQWLQDPIPLVSAHRGGPYPGYPENAIETFQNVADQTPTLIECDIVMTKDSVLVLLHDDTLDRTTTGEGKVAAHTYAELQALSLVDNEGKTSDFRIPSLDEVLTWGKGKVLFTLDVKRGVPFEKVLATVQKHHAVSYAAIITYRIDDAILVHSLHPDVLISVSAGSQAALAQIEQSGIPTNKLLGFVGTREPDQTHYQAVREMGLKTILGTLGNLDRSATAKGDDQVYLTYIENGANIIATDRPLEVAAVLQSKIDK